MVNVALIKKNLAEAESRLKGSRLKGKNLAKARFKVYSLRWRLKKATAEGEPVNADAKVSAKKVKRVEKAEPVRTAPITAGAAAVANKSDLPGYLSHIVKNLNMIRIEELVAEKICRTIFGEKSDEEILTGVNESLQRAVDTVFPKGLKHGGRK